MAFRGAGICLKPSSRQTNLPAENSTASTVETFAKFNLIAYTGNYCFCLPT